MYECFLFNLPENTQCFQVLDSFEAFWKTGYEFFLGLFDSLGKKEKFENLFSDYAFRKFLKECFTWERIADDQNLVFIEVNIKEGCFIDTIPKPNLQNVCNLVRLSLNLSCEGILLGILNIDFERTAFLNLQKKLTEEV